MKTAILRTITSAMLALIVSTAALAGETGALKASVKLNEDANVTISLNGTSNHTIEIRVFNNTGKMVTYKSLVNSGTRIFNHKLSEFPDGMYTYEIVEGDEVVYSARIFKLDKNAAEYRNMPSGPTASISKLNHEQVMVRLAGNPDVKTRIRVSDEFGNLLYWRTIKEVGNARLTYDISRFPEGKYDFRVYSGKDLIAYRKVNK